MATTIDQFAEVLTKEPDWYSLGVFLGVRSHDMDRIKLECQSISITRCLIEVHKCLERLGKVPSWDFVADRLRAIGNHGLAEEIDSMHIRSSLEPSSSSESSSNNSEQSGETSRAPPREVTVPPEVSKQYVSLTTRLTKLYFCVRKAISGTDVNIVDVQHIIERDWGLKPYAGTEATWENVFHRIDKECIMFDDPHVLSVIIDTFLPDNQVLSSQMGEFKKAVDSFKSSAKMGYLVDLLKKNKQSKRQNCQIIRLKVQEHWNRCILKNFETAMKMLLGSLHRHLSYLSVDKGCYCISWIIVADILHASQALPKHSKEYFKIIGVISFQIGEEMVYDSNGKVQGCAVLEAAMLQAIELNNTQAIELLLAVGCSPEVATCKGHAVTNVLNIRERSVDDSSEGGVDHVCVLGHNEHIEAIVNTMIREKECVACQMKEKQIKQLHSMQFERKDHDEIQELTKKLNEKDAELTKVMEQLKFKDDGEAEDSTEQQLRSQVAESASLISALTEQIKSKDLAFIALMGEKEQLKEELKHEVELKKKEEKKSLQKVQLEKDVKIQKWTEKLQEKDAELKKLTELLKGTRWPPTSDAYYCRHVY